MPSNPVSPPRLLLLAAVQVGGLVAAAAVAFVLVRAEHNFHELNDLRALGLPVLGAISLANPTAESFPWRSALCFCFATVLLLSVFTGLLLRPILMEYI